MACLWCLCCDAIYTSLYDSIWEWQLLINGFVFVECMSQEAPYPISVLHTHPNSVWGPCWPCWPCDLTNNQDSVFTESLIDSKICQSITTLIPVYDGYLTFIPRMDLGMRLNDCHGNHILVILDRWLLYEGCHEFLGSRNSSDTIGEYSTNWKKCTGVQFRRIQLWVG